MIKLEFVDESDILSIYSPHIDGEAYNEFEKFIMDYGNLENPYLQNDYKIVLAKINQMFQECGARENLFRPEGKNIKAVPLIVPGRSKNFGSLRLYCIRLSDNLLIIGNGGIKKVPKYQDDPYLNAIVEELKSIEHLIFLQAKRNGIEYDDTTRMKKILEKIELK